jgi:hypothetical protein
MTSKQICEHLSSPREAKVGSKGVCDECVKTGSSWVHLRTCQICGGTHCCDSSPNKHATAHWKSSGHPVIASAEPGERWLWCYPDEMAVEY